ncbi:DUF2974 domain-containing protein, partial [Mediterraneibacter gnavus]
MNVTLEKLAEKYVDEIISLSSDEDDIVLGGWSFGGLWALEVYKQLKDRRKIKYLAIVDSLQPGVELDTIEEFTLKEEKGIVQKYISPLIDLESVTDTEMLWHIVIQYFRENVDSFEKFKNSFGNLSFVLQESEPEECIKKFNLFRTLSNAQTKYRPEECIKKFNLFRTLSNAQTKYREIDVS